MDRYLRIFEEMKLSPVPRESIMSISPGLRESYESLKEAKADAEAVKAAAVKELRDRAREVFVERYPGYRHELVEAADRAVDKARDLWKQELLYLSLRFPAQAKFSPGPPDSVDPESWEEERDPDVENSFAITRVAAIGWRLHSRVAGGAIFMRPSMLEFPGA